MLNARIKKSFARVGTHDDSNDAFALDVDLALPPGVTVLFGASGSGKTLTLKSLAGLVRPDEGRIEINGSPIFDSARNIDLPIRARGAGYVFQHLALFPHLDALSNVAFPITHLARKERDARALELLDKFRVGHTARRLPRNISGGEAQRVALARALASDPRFLLLDEPLSALDEATKLDIISDLKQTNRELRLPVVYVTHSRDEALALGERAYVYERGRIVAAGAPHEVFGAPVKASVARLTGVENIFEGVVVNKDERAGTMTVELESVDDNACHVEAPLGRQQVGTRVTVAIRSSDILLAVERPHGISARNVLAGTVRVLEERGDETLARVGSGVEWAASVTRQSVAELELQPGKHVWLAFKTFSCRVFDAE